MPFDHNQAALIQMLNLYDDGIASPAVLLSPFDRHPVAGGEEEEESNNRREQNREH